MEQSANTRCITGIDAAGRRSVTLSFLYERKGALVKVRVEPLDHPHDAVPVVLGFGKVMAFVFVDHQFSFDAERSKGVPKFVRLRRRTLAVAIANQNESGSFCFFYEGNRRAFRVNLRIFVDRLAEK